MENTKHLTEVLKSQISLYTELADLIVAEKEAIVSWAVEETVELTKKKAELLRREKIQEQARRTLLKKMAAEAGDELNLNDVIALITDEAEAEHMRELQKTLVALISRLQAENLSLRSLYITNNKLISDFFQAAGFTEGVGYGPAGTENKKVYTIQRFG